MSLVKSILKARGILLYLVPINLVSEFDNMDNEPIFNENYFDKYLIERLEIWVREPQK